MENKILEFSKQLQANKENIPYNKNRDHLKPLGKPEYTFYLESKESYEGFISIYNPHNTLIELDEEDINYFKNKYLPYLEDEYQKQLQELNKKYNRC